MAKTSSSDRLINRAILILLGVSVAGLYIGSYITPHPNFSGESHYKSDIPGDHKKAAISASQVDSTAKQIESQTEGETQSVALPSGRLESLATQLNYRLPEENKAGLIPATFISAMPVDIADLPVQDRKELFIRIMLPLIIAANDAILEERASLDTADINALVGLARQYRVKDENLTADELRDELDKRIRPIPVSLALAQAAIESGWGTSRFTKEANALYGQWAWRAEDGVKPLEASNSRAVIRKFDTLQASVHSYMKNLNSHYAYAEFRDRRAKISASGKQPNGMDLAAYMKSYAETGIEYVETIRSVISRNKFSNYNRLSLNTG